MLKETISKDTDIIKNLIEATRNINIPVIKYNDENSLECIITFVYLSARSESG